MKYYLRIGQKNINNRNLYLMFPQIYLPKIHIYSLILQFYTEYARDKIKSSGKTS
jgi:hypothetical protein